MIQFLQATKDSVNVTKEVVTAIETGHTEQIIEKLIDLCIGAGKNILIAIVVYFVGRFLISLLQRLMANMLERRKVEVSIQIFLKTNYASALQVQLITKAEFDEYLYRHPDIKAEQIVNNKKFIEPA